MVGGRTRSKEECVTRNRGFIRGQFSAVCFRVGITGAVSVVRQLFLAVACMMGASATAQNHGTDYVVNSQPPLLNYQELVTLGETETVDPALASKLNTLLTTPFVNNEAYFAGVRPLRPDLKGLGPSLRLVQWNIERVMELDDIKLLMTDKQGFLAKVHAEKPNGDDKAIDEELSAQMDVREKISYRRWNPA
jgi:hypothetical protein